MPRLGTHAVLVACLLVLGLPGGSGAQGPPGGEAPIRLQSGTFLPSRGEPGLAPGVRVSRFAPGVRGTYIVQLAGPVEDPWKDAVAAAGGELLEYIPDFAFKVRMTPAQAQAVRRLAPVRWVGFFHPAYKLSPRLKRGGQRLYTVRLEHGTDGAAAANALAAAGGSVASREGGILTVSADESHIEALAQLPDVAWIEDYELREKHNEYAGQILGAPTAWTTGVGYDGSTQTVAVADTGLGGGTAATAHADLPASRITSIFNWPGAAGACFQGITNDGARDVDSGHGTHVSGSVLGGGNAAGKGKGIAPGARLVFQAVENWATTSSLCKIYGYPNAYYLVGLPADLRTLFQQAYTAGARVHSNSWGSGSTSAYTTDSQNLDDFVWNHRDATVTFSAGNAGVDADANGGVDPRSLAAQATAKNVLSVGASENDRAGDYACDPSLGYTTCATQGGQNSLFTYGSTWPTAFPAAPLNGDLTGGNAEQMAAFSSRGPADDGRIKPDLVAPGTWVLSTYADLYQQGYDPAANPQNGLYQYDGWAFPLSSAYKYLGGTSMSNPLVAGGAAVVRDYYQKAHGHSASAALVKATLINSAVDLLDEDNNGVNDNSLPIPNVFEGWGRANLAAAVDGSRAFRDEGPTLSTGGVLSYTYAVAPGTPLRVSLVWTDPPASLSSLRRLVNDLDLEVSSPGAVLYKGNAFAVSSGGWTLPNSGVPDRANNVENVYVQSPAAGNWTITLRGYNVPQGPQSFALVVAGQSVQPVYALTVTAPAHGTIASPDGFIHCGTAGTSCSHSYTDGTNVSLDAVPDPGYLLSAWTGACSGAGTCTVAMSQARTVGATFAVASVPSLTIGDATVSEGNCGQKTAVFTVGLSAPSALTVTVNAATADGTATTAGQDYLATSGTLVFGPGVTSQTIAVTVLGDTTFEADETFAVTLSGPVNATVATATGTGTIANDDAQLGAGQELVVWTRLAGVAACGPDLTKTAVTAWGNAGASSTRAIVAGGAGSAEFTIPSDPGFVLFGLGNGDTDLGYADVDFAFYTYPPTGQLMVFENGVYRGQFGAYSAGGRARIAVQGGQVQYLLDGALLYTSATTPSGALRVDTSFYSTGATVLGATLAGTLANTAPPTEAVTWQNLVGAAATATTLTKTAPAGWTNGGASSTRGIPSGSDGYAEFTVPASPGYAMFGLSSGDTDLGYADVDYAFYTYPPTGQLMVFEKGVYRGQFGAYTAGDKLRVSVESGVVRYWFKGTLAYTSSQTPTFPLRVDTSLYSTGATVQEATLAGSLIDVTPPTEAVAWQNAVGVSAAGATLTKTALTAWGNAGASSTRGIPSGNDGYAEFTVPAGPGYALFGLSNGDTDQGYADVDFAFYTYPPTGQLLVFENGVYRGQFGAYTAGDKLRVSVGSGVVKYWFKGTLVLTSGQAPAFPLRVDTSLYSTGAVVQDATLAGNLVNVGP